MSVAEFKAWLIAATVFSVVTGFILSVFNTRKKFGDSYSGICVKAFGRLTLSLLPFLLYSAVSVVSGGWAKVVQSPEIAMGAFLIFLMSAHEMGCSLSVSRNYPVVPSRVAMLSMWTLLWLCTSLTSAILIFQANELPTPVFIWQLILLVVAVLTYFSTCVVVRLIEVGYQPSTRKSH